MRPGELLHRLVRRAPGGQARHGRHPLVTGRAQGRPRPHRVTDEAHRRIEPLRKLVDRPFDVADGVAVVVADDAVAQLGDGQAAAAPGPGEVAGEREHAQGRRAQVRVGGRAARLAAVDDQRHAARLAARGDGDERRSAVGQGSGDATGRDGVHAGHSPHAPDRIVRTGDGVPVRWGLGCLSRSGGQGHAEERDDGQARSRGGGSRGGGARGAVAQVAGGRRRGRCDGPARTARRAGDSAEEPVARCRGGAGGAGRGARGRPPWPSPTVAETETETLEAALALHRNAAAHAHRPAALTHVGRPRELGSAEWPQPRPVAALGSAGRTQAPLHALPGREWQARGGGRLRGDGRHDQHGPVGMVRHPVRDAAEDE